MDQNKNPTKGNLIRTRHILELARQGYVLLDQKRIVLMREAAELNQQLKELQHCLDMEIKKAKTALVQANIVMGAENVESVALDICCENTVRIQTRNLMGIEVPLVSYDENLSLLYSLDNTTAFLDAAYSQFNKVKKMIMDAAALQTTVYILNTNISKIGKRANALQYIIIPKYEAQLKFIQNALEERERDGFVRLKVIKNWKDIL